MGQQHFPNILTLFAILKFTFQFRGNRVYEQMKRADASKIQIAEEMRIRPKTLTWKLLMPLRSFAARLHTGIVPYLRQCTAHLDTGCIHAAGARYCICSQRLSDKITTLRKDRSRPLRDDFDSENIDCIQVTLICPLASALYPM